MATLLRGAGFITGAASGMIGHCRPNTHSTDPRSTKIGIGKATAHSFARHGARQLALADINLSAAQTATREIESSFSGVDVIATQTDVTSEASINDAVAAATRRFGRIDFAANSAGIGGSPALSAEHSVDAWSKALDVNLTGVWMSSRAEIRAMLRQQKSTE